MTSTYVELADGVRDLTFPAVVLHSLPGPAIAVLVLPLVAGSVSALERESPRDRHGS